ncbi:lipase 3 [Microplitis demolitor]|uniref:lipase 3 n=1 Tax=Microplitis demolitor TaxID=69319 RepID=UPI00043FFFA8|nr:lipase 3 [Microplitis demolitor]
MINYKLVIFIYFQVLTNFIASHRISKRHADDNYNLERKFEILQDYKLERYVFPEVIPNSESEINNFDELNSTIVYRLKKNPFLNINNNNNDDIKGIILLRQGFECRLNNCCVNKLQMAVAYLLVDQGYDIWLGIDNKSNKNLMMDELIENDNTYKVAQFILLSTGQSELIVMDNNNKSNNIYEISSNIINTDNDSRISKWWNGVKSWVVNVYRTGKNYVTSSYEARVNDINEIGEKVDHILENKAIDGVKQKILNAYGIFSSMLPTLKIDIFSKLTNDPDTYLSTAQLIKKYGYNVETHTVITKDGYVLTLHRISGGKKYPPKAGKPVVYLQHGLLSDSASWVLTGPSHGLGYILSDEKYDVWMGNSRGTTQSRAHVNLTTDDPLFWNFSFNEIGLYDLPAIIDYILNETGEKKLNYIGHSQGTSILFVLLSERPEYNDKINKFIAYAPIAYVGNVQSPIIRALAPAEKRTAKLMNYFEINELLSANSLLTKFVRGLCEARTFYRIICTNAFFLLNGYDLDQINKTTIPVLLAHLPAGGSTKQIVHYAQEINSKKFRKFDYNPEENIKMYGQIEPPEYKLCNTKIPVALMYGPNDLISVPTDVSRLSHKLTNLQLNYTIPYPQFNHLDFTFAMNAPELVYRPTLDFLKSD